MRVVKTREVKTNCIYCKSADIKRTNDCYKCNNCLKNFSVKSFYIIRNHITDNLTVFTIFSSLRNTLKDDIDNLSILLKEYADIGLLGQQIALSSYLMPYVTVKLGYFDIRKFSLKNLQDECKKIINSADDITQLNHIHISDDCDFKNIKDMWNSKMRKIIELNQHKLLRR